MKRIIHSAETVSKDAMGEKNVLKITIPLIPPENDDEARKGFVEIDEGLERALGDARNISTATTSGKVRVAYKFALDIAKEDAAPLSKPNQMHVVTIDLEYALDVLNAVPDNLKQDAEHALDAAFRAGREFQSAFMRERHLEDVEREHAQAKARDRGRDEARRTSLIENRELIKYMRPLIERENQKVLTVARSAAKRGLGSQSGDIKRDAAANRSRYNRWKSREKNN